MIIKRYLYLSFFSTFYFFLFFYNMFGDYMKTEDLMYILGSLIKDTKSIKLDYTISVINKDNN